MKEKILNFTFCLFCFLSIFLIFKNNQEVAKVIENAINLFISKVFVSLFPMFIINDILISLNIPYYFYHLFNKIFLKIFHTSGLAAYVLIMSLISGTPSNAYILKELVNDNKLSNAEASHLLAFTYFSNPLFLIMMLNTIFDTNTSIKIIIIHYISNLIIGFILRKQAPTLSNKSLTKKTKETGSMIIKSINRSIQTLLMILGTVTFYMLVTYILTSIISNNMMIKTAISSFLEITNGLNNLSILKINNEIKEIIAVATISFGGLSIHTQIKSILEDTKITYQSFLKGRIMHTIIAVILIIIF